MIKLLISNLVIAASLISPCWAGDILLTTTSYGPVHLGMPITEAAKKLNQKVPDTSKLSADCDSVDLGDVSFMIIGFKIYQIDVYKSNAITPSGIKIGDPIEKVKRIFGSRVSDDPEFYTGPENRTLKIYFSKDRDIGMRFDIEGENRTISYIYAGHGISLVEGCS